MRYCWLGITLFAMSAAVCTAADADSRSETRFRRPVAACSFGNSSLLFVANRDSGSVSVIETQDWTILHETVLGTRLSDMHALDEPRMLLAVDEEESAIILIRVADTGLEVLNQIPVPASPVSVTGSNSGHRVCVASLWPRRLRVFNVIPDRSAEAQIRLEESCCIQLPFPPRLQRWLPDGERIIVADAFAGRLAVVNAASEMVEWVHELPAHNIRGLAVSPDGGQLLIAHQLLSSEVGTTYDAIHWGDLAVNVIRAVPVSAVLTRDADLVAAGWTIRIGSTGNGAGDPGAVLPLDDGRVIAVASGVDRAEVFPVAHSVVTPWLETGRRPTAIALVPGGNQAAVLNTLDDSLTVLDLATEEAVSTVSLGPTPEPGPLQRGESLFFDARLSHDNWISCHSCHTDGHTNGLLVDTTSDGTLGTPKRVLSLLGTRDNNPWAWNGSLPTLHDQVRHSVSASMQGLQPTPQEVIDLVTYLQSLDAPPGVAPVAVSPSDADLLERGRDVFAAQRCGDCHVPPLTYTSDRLVDVGLTDERGLSKFNPPSLRGVSQQSRFFHDGRAESLRSVFEEHGHQLDTGLNEDELQALIRFLESL